MNVPLVPAGLGGLVGKRILLVDDSLEVFRAFIPPLVAATAGSACFLLQRSQDVGVLASDILSEKPDCVLLDEELGGVRGLDVLRGLGKQDRSVRVIGFSSAASLRDAYRLGGAVGFVEKELGDPWGCLRRIAEILTRAE